MSSPSESAAGPTVGAVVVNHDGGEALLRCVRQVRGQTRPAEAVVVVDSGSTDGSPDRVRAEFPDVDVVELGDNLGPSASRNLGLRHLETDLVLCVDADTYLEPDALECLRRAHVDRGATIVCPRVVLLPEDRTVQCDGAGVHFLGTIALRHAFRPRAELSEETARDWVGGCITTCLLVDRRAALAAGGFEEIYFFYFEDLEFSLKMRARGHRVFCEPSALVWHERGAGTPGLSYRPSIGYPARRAHLSMRNRWLTILTYYRVRTLAVLLPALVVYEGATLGIAALRGWLPHWARAWGWLLRHRREVAVRRRRAQFSRAVPDRELLEGGPLPIAPGFARSAPERVLLAALQAGFDLYWAVARRWIG